MKKISIFLFTIVVTMFAASCDQGFEETNIDPNRPSEVPANLLLGNTIRQTQAAMYGVQQGGDMGLCWAQHWSKVQYNDEERYIPRRGSIDNVWSQLYAGVIYDAKVMEGLAIKEGNTNLQAVALIVQANAFQILTDLYGPVPFSEAGIKGNLKPKFDSQEQVYDGVLAMLTSANNLLASGSGEVSASEDIVYGGDVAKWKKFGNSLKLKALMRISDKRNVNAELQALVNSGNLMTSNADSANITNLSASGAQNPMFVGLTGREEYKISTVLVSALNALSDPRLSVFAAPIAGGTYVGNVPGDESQDFAGKSGVGSFYKNAVLPGVILSYAQVQFYLAEATVEGKISGGVIASKMYFKNGVTANFLFNGLTVTAANTYLTDPTLNYTDAATGSPIIGAQMWFALYGQGFEAWTEWRRTKYPVLSPVLDPGVPTIPSRLFYSTVSETANQANFAAAVSTIAGGNELTSKVWWML